MRTLAGALLLAAGIFTPALGSPTVNVSVSVRPSHKVPPAAVDDLTAVTADMSTGEGRIDLSWTAPDTEWNIEVTGYYIRWSTLSVTDLAENTTSWWEQADGADMLTYMHPPGTPAGYTAEDLIPGVVYYFAIKAVDEFGNVSPVDTKTQIFEQAHARASTFALDPIITLTGDTGLLDGEIKLQWISVGGDEYEVRYNVNEPVEGNEQLWWDTSLPYAIISSPQPAGEEDGIDIYLTPGTTYYITVRAKLVGYPSPIGNFVHITAGDAVPAAPEGLELTWTGNDVRLTWKPNSEPDINEYEIWRSTEGGTFVHIASTSSAVYYDGSAETFTTYIYRLRAVDDAGQESGYGAEEEIFTGEFTSFGDVDYIIVKSLANGVMTFGWNPVSDSAGLEGYQIQRSQDIRSSSWSDVAFVSSTDTLSFPVSLTGDTYFYRVLTVAKSGVRSAGSISIDTSGEYNHWYTSSDRNAFLRIPYSFAKEVYPESAGGNGVQISIVRVEENNGYLMTYRVKATRNGREIEDFRFDNTRKGAELIISYSSIVQVGALSASEDRELAMFWHNGVKWMKLGGVSDQRSEVISTYSRRPGKFALGFDVLSSEFRLNYVEPKIFTPEEGDYRINEVSFYFENPKFLEVIIRIFDVNGREIRKNLRRDGENKMVWDGRDESGNIVRGGVYIYQVEADGKVINGTIVVAK